MKFAINVIIEMGEATTTPDRRLSSLLQIFENLKYNLQNSGYGHDIDTVEVTKAEKLYDSNR